MGKIGCLGDIPFEVSGNKIQTPKNMKWSGSARYATHQRHGGEALTEFVGNNPDKFTFKMLLSAYLGVDPMKLAAKIVQYRREGKALPLVIGDKTYGQYRWTILNHDIEITTTDGDGNVVSITVSITLQEYLRK